MLVHPAQQLEIKSATVHTPSFAQMAIFPLPCLSAPDPVLSKLVKCQFSPDSLDDAAELYQAN